MRFFERRLLVVIGKGGVGRTTLAAALGLAAATHGKRVLLAELGGTRHLAEAFGQAGRSYTPRPVAPGVSLSSLSATECLRDFGERKLRLGGLVPLVLKSRITRAFLDAVPGLHDLLQLGKIENLLNEPLPTDPVYDLCIVDAPATGHGLTLLSAARAMREMTRVGPFADLARLIETLLHGPSTGVIAVTLAEELPVNETLELLHGLEERDLQVTAVLMNRMKGVHLPATPPWTELRGRLEGHLETGVFDTLDRAVADIEHQASASESLHRALGGRVPVTPLPFVEAPDRIAQLAEQLVGEL